MDLVAQARYWLERAQSQGHSEAALELGGLAEGEEAGLTLEDAVTIYEKIISVVEKEGRSSFNSLRATRRLGDIYFDGKVKRVPEPDKAILCFRRLCRSVLEDISNFSWFRDFDSLYKLGLLLESKEGDDLIESFQCFKQIVTKASDTAPFPDLELRLGRMYEEGRGTEQDDGWAAYYYKLALKKGNAEAGERLARLHEQGRGLTWFEKIGAKLAQLMNPVK